MQGIEKALDDLFKKLPSMPESGRKMIAQASPWIALIVGVISLYLAWQVYQLTTLFNSAYSVFGYALTPALGMYGPVLWVSLIILVVQAVLLLVAFPSLRTGKKSGWNLLLWGALISLVYDVVYNLFSGYINIGQFIFSLLGSAIGLYILFQIRGEFVGSSKK